MLLGPWGTICAPLLTVCRPTDDWGQAQNKNKLSSGQCFELLAGRGKGAGSQSLKQAWAKYHRKRVQATEPLDLCVAS